ncbi:hypothetical protein BB559_002317 [Furculomyces boomerangus]|uniref:Metal resistance protein YCF1 n=1 Tax=Furculomyces boomerangus TaxID=61424 RepID=A0A2T9YWG0_9FUNG|nr:hypothetical protein BB559_002317 [Furculomyces boomerangus]
MTLFSFDSCPNSEGWGPFGGWNNTDFTICFENGPILAFIQLTFLLFGFVRLTRILKEKQTLAYLVNSFIKPRKVTLVLGIFLINTFKLWEWSFRYSGGLDYETENNFNQQNNLSPDKCDFDDSIEDNSNLFSCITFSWMSSLIKTGFQKTLESSDLWNLPKAIKTKLSSKQFWDEWSKEKNTSRESVSFALLHAYGGEYIIAGIFKIFHDGLQIMHPIILKKLIVFVQTQFSESPQPISNGYYYAGSMLVISILETFFLNQYYSYCMMTEISVRTGLVTAIYKKTLLMSNKARTQFNTGDVVNRMSVDAQRISDCCHYGHRLWSTPFQISLALYLLYINLGWSAGVGLLVIILSIYINGVVAQKMQVVQEEQMENKDSRIKLIEESLKGIKAIKLYAWEEPFLERIRRVRNNKEIHSLWKLGLIFTFQSMIIIFVPCLVTFATFLVYSTFDGHSKGPLTSDLIFVSVSLFNLLQYPLNMLPYLISVMVEAFVGIKRIQEYLVSEELSTTSIQRLEYIKNPLNNTENNDKDINKNGTIKHDDFNNDTLVSVSDADFWWEYDPKKLKPTLQNIKITVKSNELLAVVGKVGSGKSSLLTALLGEMHKSKGNVTIKGKTAFANQQPWIINATVRENILFGKKLDKAFYKKVIYACGLEQDLSILTSGDLTQIGERGINLSGGQKARLSLARAVYSQADVYFLDDPLAAVDAHVGAHLFRHVLGPKGMLRNNARILVTNAISYLSKCDMIALMQDGNIVEQGSYTSLVESNGLLTTLVRDHGLDFGSENQSTVASSSPSIRSHEISTNVLNDSGDTENSSKIGTFERHDSIESASRLSIRSLIHESEEILESDGRLIMSETFETGQVDRKIYLKYIKSCGVSTFLVFICGIALSEGMIVYNTSWLRHWANSNERGEKYDLYYLSVYIMLGVVFTIFGGIKSYSLLSKCAIKAAKSTHEKMLVSIFDSPMMFFDTTPLGRIINRFSKDQSVLDEDLPQYLEGWLLELLSIFFGLLAITIVLPAFFVVVIPMVYLFLKIQNIFIHISRDLKRLDSVSRSPIYQDFQESLGGVSTIRAFDQCDRFETENLIKVDTNQKAVYSYLGLNRWISVRLELISASMVFSVAFICVYIIHNYKESGMVNAGITGMAITFALSITQNFTWCIRHYCKVETDIISLERINEYSNLPSEELGVSNSHVSITPEELKNINWPSSGKIEFINYSTKYREGLDLVLKNINVTINAGEKVGIVGRTGAGKSSFSLALFRIIEPSSGTIIIDGVDICNIKLCDLRFNLDPSIVENNEFQISQELDSIVSDEELWNALELVHLKQYILTLEGGLDAEVLPNGENFSVGQRQLMCLARALVRKSKIIVMDEATASIDPETDAIIQGTIRSSFKNNTIITIAHRLNTVLDSDRIIVMDKGEIAEVDSPTELLNDSNSIFSGYINDLGLS